MEFPTFNEHRLNEEEKSKFGKEHPLQITLRGVIGLTSKEEPFTKKLMAKLYEKYINLVLIKGTNEYNTSPKIPKGRNNTIDYNFPIMNFTSKSHDFVKEREDVKIYNDVQALKLSADKGLFHQTFASTDFVPKAVFSLDEIKDLKEPIIAKPKDGFSAQGIELFATRQDAEKSEMEFDLWSEAKDIDREFRAFMMDGKIIHISERINNTSNDKSVGSKNPDEKIDLVYIDQEVEDFPHLDEIERIRKVVEKDIDLEFYNLDLILDKEGKLWVPEVNGAPGIGPSMFYPIYKEWCQLAYDTELPTDVEEELVTIAIDHRTMMMETYPKEFNSSLHPKKN